MKIIAHMHADLYDMEDGVEESCGAAIKVNGTGMQCLQMLCELIRSTAEQAGVPETLLLKWIDMALPLDAKADRTVVDIGAIEKLKGEG